MKRGTKSDGYILVEVLVAIAIVALAGATILGTGQLLLARVGDDLDRSATLSNVEAVAQVAASLGGESAKDWFPFDDGVYRYLTTPALMKGGTSNVAGDGLRAVTITATRLAGPAAPVSLSVLIDE